MDKCFFLTVHTFTYILLCDKRQERFFSKEKTFNLALVVFCKFLLFVSVFIMR